MLVCPHCHSHRIVTAKVPKDVVVVMPCPVCHELAVLFRNRVIPLNRKILENGTFEQRKDHLAQVIAEFLESGLFSELDGEDEILSLDAGTDASSSEDAEEQVFESVSTPIPPISKEEFDKFVRIDLKCIDNPAYFKRHFG